MHAGAVNHNLQAMKQRVNTTLVTFESVTAALEATTHQLRKEQAHAVSHLAHHDSLQPLCCNALLPLYTAMNKITAIPFLGIGNDIANKAVLESVLCDQLNFAHQMPLHSLMRGSYHASERSPQAVRNMTWSIPGSQ